MTYVEVMEAMSAMLNAALRKQSEKPVQEPGLVDILEAEKVTEKEMKNERT